MGRAMTRVGIIGALLALLVLALAHFWRRSDVTPAEAAPPVAAVRSASDGVSYEGRPLNSWIEQLKSEDEKIRHKAATALIAMGEPSYSALAQFLNSPYEPDGSDNVARDRAVASFAELGPSAVPALLAAIRLDASGDLRHNGGIAALLRMGPTAFPELEKALQDSNQEVRASALVALRFFGMGGATSPTLTLALITVLKDDPVPEVRAEAAMTLGSSLKPSKEIKSALVGALADEDEVVRVQAAFGLASSGGWTGVREAAAALPVLIQALKSEDRGVRFEAALSLTFLGPAARPAIPALTLLLKDSETGQWAADALGAIGGEAITELRKAANGTDRTARNNAAAVLGRLGHQGETSASALLADLENPPSGAPSRMTPGSFPRSSPR